MIFNMTGGGGSAGLNFKIVGDTAEPVSLSENLIWIDTDTPINSWTFSATQPETADTGMAWFSIGTSSPVAFNALKKNGIMVCPLLAKQYINGEWVSKTAKSYQGGKWVEWIPEGALYWHGNECVETSGGWVASGRASNSESTTYQYAPKILNTNEYLLISEPADTTNQCRGIAEIAKDQDLTDVSKIVLDFEGESTTAQIHAKLCVLKRGAYLDDKNNKTLDLIIGSAPVTVTRQTVELDVSALEGYYSIGISVADTWSSGAGKLSLKVYSLRKM